MNLKSNQNLNFVSCYLKNDPGISHAYWKMADSTYGDMLVGREGDAMMPPETW